MPAQSLQSRSTFSSLSMFSCQSMTEVNQWSARGWCLEIVAMVDSSSNRTEVTFAFPTDGVIREARVVDDVECPTPLTAFL